MKKRDRWLMTAALTVGVLTFAAGCGRQEETKPASASQSAVEEAEDDTSETSGTLSQEEEGKTQGTETVSVMTGTVLDAAMNSIVIQNQEYPDGIIFSKEDSAASFTDGLTLGLDATLFYTGRIQGDDTTETEVVLVRDGRDGDDGLAAFLVSGRTFPKESIVIFPYSPPLLVISSLSRYISRRIGTFSVWTL